MTSTALSEGTHAPVVDLPPPIQLALARIMGSDGGGLAELTYRERSLLARLVRNVNLKQPTDSIRVAVGTLAAALHTSDKTIQRTCASLQASGWIIREQIKKRSGMQIADTWLTPRTLELLGLTRRRPSRSASDNMAVASGLSTMSEDSQQVPGPFEKETQDPKVAQQPEAPQPEVQPPAAKVPEDLLELQTIGMRPGAIFKLMGEATKAGHRLGHIVRAAAPLIRAAKHPFGYIRKLIGYDRDWSTYTSAATRREQEARDAELGTKVKSLFDNAVKTLVEAALPAGRLLTNAMGKLVWLMRYGAVYACPVADLGKPESLRGYARVTNLEKMAEAIQDGRMFEFHPQRE